MSAFDDEFGLFGEGGEEDERKSTLGARKIASDETIIDDIEPEDERPPRRRPSAASDSPSGRRPFTALSKPMRRTHREPADPVASQQRAGDLLQFLAKKLVAKPDAVSVESFPAEQDDPPVLELTVDPEDLGKVIGRSGRVAQALRTVVRATAEGRISVDILDTDEFEDDDLDPGESDAEGDGVEK